MDKENAEFDNLKYNQGFNNHFETEAKEGAIPKNQNNPFKLKYGLYAEQLSGTSFTTKRAENQRSWVYKIRPSAVQGQYSPAKYDYKIIDSYMNDKDLDYHPNQLRWRPIPSLTQQQSKTFIEGLVSVAGAGEPTMKQGMAIYVYSANKSMIRECFYSSDGDFLIVPHSGTLYIKTNFGKLKVSPKEICVIPRGVKFAVEVVENVKGWVTECFGNHFTLPQLGVIGANGLANVKDFYYPTAWFRDEKEDWKITNKYVGKMFEGGSDYCPFDVVGWRGNYAPFKYSLQDFNTIGSISYDHPDPSIFTVMTIPSHIPGMASLDFVVFPPRWLVQQHTFKPPYYHRNCMSEFMGNICGNYDAKGAGFAPGCSSLHSCMTPHGPDAESYEKTLQSEQKPLRIADGNFSFMFESGFMLKTTKYAMNGFLEVDSTYKNDWKKLAEIKYQAPE